MSKEDSIMDFFENVKRAVSDTAQTVSKTSGKVADKVKTRYSIYDMNGEIKRILGEIGLEIYQSYKNDEAELSESILEKCRELDAKNEMIEAAESKLDSKKGTATCKNCGEKIVKNAVFCHKCGSRVDGGEEGGVTITVTEE